MERINVPLTPGMVELLVDLLSARFDVVHAKGSTREDVRRELDLISRTQAVIEIAKNSAKS